MRVFGIEGEFGRFWKNVPEELTAKELNKLRDMLLAESTLGYLMEINRN
jgi:hypothetical protein